MKTNIESIQNELTKVIKEISHKFGFNEQITVETCPSDIGISSQILVSVLSTLEDALQVAIPSNCYPFYSKKLNKQLTIKEASLKLVKITKDANE